ncbi:MAG: hypothetical protein HQL19_04725 [Candidatus Omnitrophica bacterium]|nr:hypothetical protein [Candidatus Omnitrophota bacterium]
MTPEQPALRIVTPITIKNTVLYDDQTRLWMRMVLFTPAVDEKLCAASPEAGQLYKKYIFLGETGIALLGIATFCAGATFAVAESFWLPLSAASVAAIIAAITCFILRRSPLAALAAKLIELDAPSYPPNMTLFQLGEIYARQYDTPSLVDMICQWHNWINSACIVFYFSALGLYFLPTWKIVIFCVTGGAAATLLFKAFTLLQQHQRIKGDNKKIG